MSLASPRHYRVFDPSLYHEVTQRIRNGKFLLDPNCQALKAAIYGQLAMSMRRYDVKLIALHFMTDHFHALYGIACPYKFAKFLAHFHAGITRAYNRLQADSLGPDSAPYQPVSLWHEMKWLPVATDELSIYWRLQYIMGQAVAANLVDHPAQFPGASTIDGMMDGRPLVGKSYDATKRYRDLRLKAGAQDDDAYEQVFEIQVTPPSCWMHLAAEELRHKYIEVADSVARVKLADLGRGKAEVRVAPTGEHDGPIDTPMAGDVELAGDVSTVSGPPHEPSQDPGLWQDSSRNEESPAFEGAKQHIPPRRAESGEPFEAGAPKAKKSHYTSDGKRKRRPLILAASESMRVAYEDAYNLLVEAYVLAKVQCRDGMSVRSGGLSAPGLLIPRFMLLGAMPYPK